MEEGGREWKEGRRRLASYHVVQKEIGIFLINVNNADLFVIKPLQMSLFCCFLFKCRLCGLLFLSARLGRMGFGFESHTKSLPPNSLYIKCLPFAPASQHPFFCASPRQIPFEVEQHPC